MTSTIKEKKEYAWLLFKDGAYTQKMIAEKVGVAERTITDWKQREKWEEKAKSIKQTREENLISLHTQWAAINKEVKDNQKNIVTSAQADIIKKLSASIKELENEVGYTEAYQVVKKLMKHVQIIDFEASKMFIDFADSFMQELLKHEA
jgi:hypothetical protein